MIYGSNFVFALPVLPKQICMGKLSRTERVSEFPVIALGALSINAGRLWASWSLVLILTITTHLCVWMRHCCKPVCRLHHVKPHAQIQLVFIVVKFFGTTQSKLSFVRDSLGRSGQVLDIIDELVSDSVQSVAISEENSSF